MDNQLYTGGLHMDKILINSNSIEQRATALMNAGNNIEKQTLNLVDVESTITANENAKRTFGESQQSQRILRDALELSTQEIKAINDRFLELDSQAADRMGLR